MERTVYMNWLSPPSRAVMLVATALDIPVKTSIINVMAGEHKTPEYVKKNPQHTIPMLEEDDFILWDSHAIVAYLVNAHGKSDELYPKEPRLRALIDQRLHFDSSVLFPSILDVVYLIFMKKGTTIPDDMMQKIENNLGFLNIFLEDRTYLCGSTLTIADLCCVATVSSIKEICVGTVEKFPNVMRWLSKLESLPYYQEVNAKGAVMLGDTVKGMMTKHAS